MAAIRYPYGYSKDENGVMGMGTMLTRAQLELTTTVMNLHPEFWRRSIAMMEFAAQQGIPLGVGTGWRADQPNLPGFAPNGNSNHQGFAPGGKWAVAIDFVPAPSWDWMFNNCGIFGLRTFRDVNDEPWHGQPIDIPASRNWRVTFWDLSTWKLPGDEGDDDMPLSQEDIDKIAEAVAPAVWEHLIGDPKQGEDKPAGWRLKQIQLMCRHYLGGAQDSAPIPETTLLKQVDNNVKKLL